MKFLGSQIVVEHHLEFSAAETARLVACGALGGPPFPVGVITVHWPTLLMRTAVDLLDPADPLGEDLLTHAERLEPDLRYETPPTRRAEPRVHIMMPSGVSLCTLHPPSKWRDGHRWVAFARREMFDDWENQSQALGITIKPCEVCVRDLARAKTGDQCQ